MYIKDFLKIAPSSLDFNNPKGIKVCFEHLCNLIETLYQENMELKRENQKLKDEINRLKGEKGKPDIKASASKKGRKEKKSLSKATKQKKKWHKGSKRDKIKIDKKEAIRYEGKLPADAQYKGYRSVVVQGLIIKTNNIEYQLERYYSPSEKKTYEAILPDNIEGEYDPGLKSWVLFWYYHNRTPEKKIHQMLTDIGIIISEGKISDIITNRHEGFHQEKAHIIKAGIDSSAYQHIDDTGARVAGNNQHFVVLCNDYYSAFFTTPLKNRLSIIEILNQQEELSYLINEYALTFLKERRVPAHIISSLHPLVGKGAMSLENFENKLNGLIYKIKDSHKKSILEAAAIAYYQENHGTSIINTLVCDDAKQFMYITSLRALCWIHEERHYVKLTPFLPYHQMLVDRFRAKIWGFYAELKQYKKNPNEADKIRLSNLFDSVFSFKTGYKQLDERIELTKKKKDALLVVLEHPEIPLHNNPAELALRMYVIKRKISLGTRSVDGTKSWETFFTIMDTCRKLGVNFRDYLYDRISQNYKMPSLASLIPKPS
jgi:hypothetical protein